MKMYFKGGPRHGTVAEFIPFTSEYRVPIPLPIATIQDALNASLNPGDPTPNYAVATYRNTYRATVDAAGRIGCVIYEYVRTDRA